MKIIFLDVDGVLNSVRSMIAYHDEYHTLLENRFAYSYDDPKHSLFNHIDPVAIRLLNRVTDETGAKYVISSTHRKHIPYGPDGVRDILRMKQYFSGFGLTGEVIGYTPDSNSGFRGNEIAYWLEHSCTEEVTHYAIVDDSSDMTEYQKDHHFVHTSCDEGFTLENYKELRYILGYTKNLE